MAEHADRGSCKAGCGQPGFESMEQAADWYAVLGCENVSNEQRQAWQDWLTSSHEHAEAWAYIEAVSQRFEPLRGSGVYTTAAAVAGVRAAKKGVARRQILTGIVGLSGFGVAGLLGWRHTELPEVVMARTADLRTGIGEQRDIVLSDGSHVWLNTNTALSVEYRTDMRLLKLLAGEILVETASDAATRPLIVDTRAGSMLALGTRFSVRMDGRHTRVDVFDGAVKIRNAAGDSLRVDAGRRAEFTGKYISSMQDADHAREAWHRGVILADNIPLRQLIDELARYQSGHIGVAPDVAGLSVMGVYPATDPQRALDMLEQSLPVRVRRRMPWWLTVEAI